MNVSYIDLWEPFSDKENNKCKCSNPHMQVIEAMELHFPEGYRAIDPDTNLPITHSILLRCTSCFGYAALDNETLSRVSTKVTKQ